MIYKPRVYQSAMHAFGCKHRRLNLFAGMGTGKTVASLDIIDSCLIFGWAKRVLILAPKQVAVGTWPDELAKWENFQHLSMAVVIGNLQTRIEALSQHADITVCSYDFLPWLVDFLGESWPFDMVVADEITKLKGLRVSIQQRKKKDGTLGKKFLTGQGAKRAKKLAKVVFSKVNRWIGLTGTPAPNGLQDLWALMFFVDMGQRLSSSHTAFTQRWFYREQSYGDYLGQLKPHAHSQRQIQKAIKDVCLTIEAKDYFDLKEPIVTSRYVTLPTVARQHYKEMQRELFTEVQGHGITAVNAGAKTQKCLQLASGAMYTEKGGQDWVAVHDEKLQVLESIVEEAMGMPILVSYQFKSDVARILERFKSAKKFDGKPQTVTAFNDGKIPMLVAHPASAGHGLSLQHGSNIIVFFSTGWNLEEDLQIIERIGPTRQAQSGYKRAVFVYRIIAKNTIEEDVIDRLASKAGVQDTLMVAMKRRGGKI